jgi:prepilin-type N-terminal cleavage/methylation domain-containing protein
MRNKDTDTQATTHYSLLTSSGGFTLLELLVVMAVIGILATVLVLAINPVEIGRRSRDSKKTFPTWGH